MKKVKLVYAYLMMFFVLGMYIHTNIISYQKKYEIKSNEKNIADLQKEIDSLVEDVNGVISVDILKEQYPELKLNDNVFYLKENNE